MMRILPRSTQLGIAAMLNLGLLLLIVGTASAHAKVISATPGIGSTITMAPTTITVTTIENMKPGPQNSNLFVYGPSGDLISQGDAKVSLNNPKQMSVAIKPEKDGIYIVRWTTVSADDGDPDQGGFVFTVKSTAVAAAAPAPKPTTSTSTTGSSFPVLPVVLTGLIALLAGLGAGFGFGRSRPATVRTAPSTEEVSAEREGTSTKGS